MLSTAAPTPKYFNPHKAILWGILTTVIAFNLALTCITLIPSAVLGAQLAVLCLGIWVGGWGMYGLSVMANTVIAGIDTLRQEISQKVSPATQSLNQTAQNLEKVVDLLTHPVAAVQGMAGGVAAQVGQQLNRVASALPSGSSVTAAVSTAARVVNFSAMPPGQQAQPVRHTARDNDDGLVNIEREPTPDPETELYNGLIDTNRAGVPPVVPSVVRAVSPIGG